MSDTQKEVNAAIKIQAVQRGKQVRDEKVKQEEAAIKIQAIQRGKQARDETGKSEEDSFACGNVGNKSCIGKEVGVFLR